jgi:hypothetical protein
MTARKIYPNISDEELDRRAEEALRRIHNNPQSQPKNPQGPQGPRPPKKQRHPPRGRR